MSLFKETLHKLTSTAGYSCVVNGDDPTTEAEYNEVVEWRSEGTITWTQFQTELYKLQRAAEYPDFKDYLDGIVKGDQAQVQAYIDACVAVKNKYPKP